VSAGAAIIAIARVLRWPILGGLIGAGAVAFGRYAGGDLLAPTARELGAEAGAGFAEGVVHFQRMLEGARGVTPFVGRWSDVPSLVVANVRSPRYR
jgi:hypothetical protein